MKKIDSRLSEKLDGYSLVWEDDFSGDTLNRDKWNLDTHMHGQKDLEIRYDESAVRVENDCAVLSSGKTDKNDVYFTNASLTTSERMIFKYGYVEMRAKVPFGAPSFPSFWMKSAQIDNPDVMGEIDIFEHFPERAEGKALTSTLHIWGKDLHEAKEFAWKIFEKQTIAADWHTYGFLWTEDKMELSVDGEVYGSIDLIDKDLFCDKKYFDDYYYLILNNYLYTKNGIAFGKNCYATPDDTFPINYIIDYVRLYQKNGVGSIKLLK